MVALTDIPMSETHCVPSGVVTTYPHDGAGNLNAIKKQGSATVAFTYNGDGRLSLAKEGLRPPDTMTYDAEGRLYRQEIFFPSRILTHTWDDRRPLARHGYVPSFLVVNTYRPGGL